MSTGERGSGERPVLELGPEPPGIGRWCRDLVEHRDVLGALALKDFKVRYKRAAFGVLWAVALPLVQAVVMITVFSRLGLDEGDVDYTGYVLAGITAWAYAAATIPTATGAIVDGAGLTDKVWFPRALLPLATVLANLIGLGIGTAVVLVIQLLRGELRATVLLAVPAALLLTVLVVGLTLVTSALYVWYRDIRFVVQAAMLVLFYATPVLYLPSRLEALADWIPLNPFAGAVSVFQRAFVGSDVDGRAVLSSCAYAVALLAIGAAMHRRHDRRFVDLL